VWGLATSTQSAQRGAEHAEKKGMALRAVVRGTRPDVLRFGCRGYFQLSLRALRTSARSSDLCALCVEVASRRLHRPRQFKPDSPPPPSRCRVTNRAFPVFEQLIYLAARFRRSPGLEGYGNRRGRSGARALSGFRMAGHSSPRGMRRNVSLMRRLLPSEAEQLSSQGARSVQVPADAETRRPMRLPRHASRCTRRCFGC
jgi:hypothetical protein